MDTFRPEVHDDVTALIQRFSESFVGRCIIRFLRMAGIDRCIVLSSQAFTALIPLLMLVASRAPAGEEDFIADIVIRKFALTEESADSVELLFSTPAGAASSLSVLSALLLVFSAMSFARRLQAMYRAAWEQKSEGMRSGLYAALGLVVLVLELAIVYGIQRLVQGLRMDWLWAVPIQVGTGLVLWTSIPYLLMTKHVHWRRLLAGGAAAALGTTAFAAATTLYMPGMIEKYTNDFGLFGVTIAIIGWLLAAAGILIASAAIGAEFDAARGARLWALKTRFQLHDPDYDMTELAGQTDGKGLTSADLLMIIRVLINWLILTAAVWAATALVPGLEVDGGFVTYLAISVLFGFINALLGPLLQLVAMPLSVVTLGCTALVINGVLLATTAGLAERFSVDGLGSAVLGALVITIVTTILELVLRPVADKASDR